MRNIYLSISITFLLTTLMYIKKRTLDFKLSMLWLVIGISTVILSMLPKLLDMIAIKLHIAYAPSILFLFGILFSFILIFSLTLMLSDLKKKLSRLSQEVAILKGELVNK